MFKKIVLALLLFVTCLWGAAQDTAQKIQPGRYSSKAQQQKPYVILISVDGLRHDFAEKYGAKNLQRLSRGGVRAEYMKPSFPSLTFPNHYTLVTGLYPAHHGIVSNRFYNLNRTASFSMYDTGKTGDAGWFLGTPLWVLAEQQQMVTASYFWVGSEAPIKGLRPTYSFLYNEKTGINARIRTVKQWLTLPEDRRPHFISFYFSEVDHEAHEHGPDSKEAAAAVRSVDRSIAKLVATVDSLKLPVNYIVVSDHGMTTVDNKYAIKKPVAIDPSKFLYTSEGALVHLYAKDRSAIQPLYQQLKKEAKGYTPYLHDSIPASWHYGGTDDLHARVGDIILLAKAPHFFLFGDKPNKDKGKHGYTTELRDMRASFYAWGPAFKQKQIGPFENVHVFPLVAHLLGLKYDDIPIDGNIKVLSGILN